MKVKLPRLSFRSRRSRIPSIQSLIVIFITLFVLLLWFNFALAQRIESTGRKIQTGTEELGLIERESDAYRREIAEAMSQAKISERARLLGYQPQAPIFLTMGEPLAEPVSAAPPPAGQSTTLASGAGEDDAAHRLLLLLSGKLGNSGSVTAP